MLSETSESLNTLEDGTNIAIDESRSVWKEAKRDLREGSLMWNGIANGMADFATAKRTVVGWGNDRYEKGCVELSTFE